MRSNSLWTSFRLIVGLRDEVAAVVLLVTVSLSRAPNIEVGDEPPDDAFLDNKDWKKLAKTSWDGPPGCPVPLPVSIGGKDEAAVEGEADDVVVTDGKPMLVPLPAAEVDELVLVDN